MTRAEVQVHVGPPVASSSYQRRCGDLLEPAWRDRLAPHSAMALVYSATVTFRPLGAGVTFCGTMDTMDKAHAGCPITEVIK